MAKIIYSVAGEGFGHSSRAHLVGQRLLEAGHEIIFAASDKALVYLRQYFGERVKPVFGLTFAYVKGKVKPFRTVTKNVRKFPEAVRVSRALFKEHFGSFNPDIVLTDFEPFVAWWAFVNNIPYISIDNEHSLVFCRLEHRIRNLIPRLTSSFVTKFYYSGAESYIVINFFRTAMKSGKAVLAPPIVRKEVMQLEGRSGDYIVVYMTTSFGEKRLTDILGSFGAERFVVYGFDKDYSFGNCIFKRRSTEGFLSDMAGSKGVISTAGFSLLSECLYYKKKMLLLPVAGQYEQIINAQYVEKLGLGVKAKQLNESSLKRFLNCLEKPMGDDESILWPDNEGFFRIFQQKLDETKTGVKIKIL